MVAKQLRLVCLLLIGLCFKQNSLSSMEGQYIPIDEPFVYVERPEIVIDEAEDLRYKQKFERNKSQKQLTIKSVTAEDIALYEEAFGQAPPAIKYLIHGIKKRDELACEYKYILLAGPSGSGKSTLAQTFAYKLNKKFCVISAPSLLAHYRDQATENLRALFKEWNSHREKPVLIFDEINVLTDDHTSEHSDTKHTATQLWTLLDTFEKDPDFLFIGTTNVTKKMPHQLQSRFKGNVLFIDNPSLESCKKAIEFCIKKRGVIKDETVTETYLNELAQKIINFSRRDIDKLVRSSLLQFAIDNPDVSIKTVSKAYLDRAYANLVHENEKIWDFSEQMTAEERRHAESLAQSKKQFEENKDMHLKTTELNLKFQAALAHMDTFKEEKIKKLREEALLILFPNRDLLLKDQPTPKVESSCLIM